MSGVRTDSLQHAPPKTQHAGLLVVTALLAASVPLGVLAFVRFKAAEVRLRGAMTGLTRAGASLTAEQCVEQALRLRGTCPGMQAVCDHSVGDAMEACLRGRDRTPECDVLGDHVHSTRFGFESCRSRQMRSSERAACATAYRAIAAECLRTRGKS